LRWLFKKHKLKISFSSDPSSGFLSDALTLTNNSSHLERVDYTRYSSDSVFETRVDEGKIAFQHCKTVPLHMGRWNLMCNILVDFVQFIKPGAYFLHLLVGNPTRIRFAMIGMNFIGAIS
jgi:hypothetical protein